MTQGLSVDFNAGLSHFLPVFELLQKAAKTITEPFRKRYLTATVEYKRDGSPVTEADRGAEAFLIDGLTKILPNSKIFGEEGHENGWRQSPLIEDVGQVWTVDPIDGTKSFINGGPYGIMVSLRENKITKAAWVYYPVTDDLLFASHELKDAIYVSARDDQGRRIQSISSIPHKSLSEIALAQYGINEGLYATCGFSDTFPNHRLCVCAANEIRQLVLQGTCAAINYIYVAPWDFAPTSYIVEKAGGAPAVNSKGAPYKWGDDCIIMAPSENIRSAIVAKAQKLATLHNTP